MQRKRIIQPKGAALQRWSLLGCGGLLALAISLAIPDSTAAESAYDRCVAAYDNQDWDRVLADCEAAIQSRQLSDQGMGDAYMRRCWAYRQTDQLEPGLRDCDQALQHDPGNATAYNVRGSVLRLLGELDRALADFDRALSIDPDFASAYNNRGNALDNKGEYDRALRDFDRAIELRPDYALAYNNRGNTNENLSRYDRALSDYDEALRLNPDFAIAYNNRGNVHFYRGAFAQAADDISRAIDLGIDTPYSALWRFLAQRRAGLNGAKDLETFAATFDMKKWPGPVINYYLGRIDGSELLQVSLSPSNPKLEARKACEYAFYFAQGEVLGGSYSSAQTHLERASAPACKPVTIIEYHGARAELARLPR